MVKANSKIIVRVRISGGSEVGVVVVRRVESLIDIIIAEIHSVSISRGADRWSHVNNMVRGV